MGAIKSTCCKSTQQRVAGASQSSLSHWLLWGSHQRQPDIYDLRSESSNSIGRSKIFLVTLNASGAFRQTVVYDQAEDRATAP